MYESGAAEEEATAFSHEDFVAHHRQIRAAGDAHAHDRGDLGNAHGAHHVVVAGHAPEVIGVGGHSLLEREENAGGIDQVNCGHVVFDGDVLASYYFLCGHREKRAVFHRRVVRD